MQTREAQAIKLPAPVDVNWPTAVNDRIIQTKLVKAVGKRQMKLRILLMRAYTTVFGKCLQEVKDKLEGSDGYKLIQRKQFFHKLVQKIEWICMGFDDHLQAGGVQPCSVPQDALLILPKQERHCEGVC